MPPEGDTPSPGKGERSGSLALLGSPAARLTSVLIIAAAIIGGVYLVSEIEPTGESTDQPVAAPSTIETSSARDSIIGVDDLPGFDTSGLTDKQRLWLYHKANLEQCACDCGMTVAQCRIEDPTCPVSPGRAQELVEEAAKIDG